MKRARAASAIGRSICAAAVLTTTLATLATRAQAAAPPISGVTAATPLSGGHGWLVWSAPVPGGWALMGYNGKTVAQLPVSPRPQPFDASVGTDASGAPVVVFSRCSRTPEMQPSAGEAAGGELEDPLSGSGCRIHELALAGGPERTLPIPVPTRASDTTPAIWMGVVTFGRHAPAHGKVMQVMSWSPQRPHRLQTLPHGVIPPGCAFPGPVCKQYPAEGEVTALAADRSTVAFVWSVSGGVVGIDGERELRVDRTDGRGSALADGEIGHEACTSAAAGQHVLESVDFEPPFVAGRTATFGELYDFGCFTGFSSYLMTHGAAPGYASRGKLEALALATAQDEGQVYGLVPPAGEDWTLHDSPFCSTASPCTIEALGTPAFKRDSRLPYSPTQFYG